jgi:Xaa-Pro dipeptidase
METDAWFVSPRQYERLADKIRRAGGTAVDTPGGGAVGLEPVKGGEASAAGLISMRMTKSPEEIEYQRAAARIVSAGMAAAIGSSHEGANENDVAADSIATMTRMGGEYAGLPQFITSGPRTGITHSTWSGRVYQAGDVHRKVFAKYGLEHLHVHRTGYSLGVNYPPDWGEGHIISIYENDHRVFEPGMTFHLGIAMYDLSFGSAGSCIGTSETVTVTDTGCEVLTSAPRESFVV